MRVTPLTNDEGAEAILRERRWCGGLRSLLSHGVLATVAVGVLSMGSPSVAMADDACANAAVRAQTGSTGLPDCRGYEMVSPPYKGGFAIEPSLTFDDGGVVSYQSFGSFAGNPQGNVPTAYHATRSASGWTTTALAPPDVLYNAGGDTVAAESNDLRTSLWRMSRRDVPGDHPDFYLRGLDGVFTRIGDAEDDAFGGRIIAGVSGDLSHIFFNHGSQGPGRTDLFEYAGINNGSSARAVSIDNNGQQTPGEKCPNSVSADGRVIVYTGGCNGGIPQIWARVGGTATIAVSGPECTRSPNDPQGACQGDPAASYAGAATDGSRVFFTTSHQLVNGDTDTTNDLYACDIPGGTPAPIGAANPCAPLTQVSGTASDARVERVAGISEDGSRVFFVARGVLADNLGVGDVGPATGGSAHNLYLWQRDAAHPAGQTQFVAQLDSDDVGRAQTTPDGRYLLFLTTSKLVGAGPASDTDDAVDAYRYDMVTKTMVRMSTSVPGSSGGNGGFGVSLAVRSSITADGSAVIFDTGEALSGNDTNGVTDVYAWHDGQVSVISARGGNAMGITSTGSDIFFLSAAQLLAADGDFNKDIYDARVGGGFAFVQSSPCSGDGCQSQRSQLPVLAAPLALATSSDGLPKTAPTFSLRAVSTAQRKALAASGKISLVITANTPGTVSVRATATIAGRSAIVGSARRNLSAPGRAAVSWSLSRKARSQLAARGRLTVKVAVSHSKVALDRSVTLKLVHAKAKAERSVVRRSVAGVSGGAS